MNAPRQPASPSRALTRRHHVSRRSIAGFTTYAVTPAGCDDSSPTVLYLHGGAYISPITGAHWKFIGGLADAGAKVVVPLYPLAPRYTAADTYTFLYELYTTLIARSTSIAVAGDSAGGGLALGLSQTLPPHLPQPDRLVLISPWLDASLTNPEIAEVEHRDPWLSREGLIEAGLAWAGEWSTQDPRVSPIRASTASLPPTDVYIGDRDILHPDVRRYASTAASHRRHPITLVEQPGAIHVYPLTPTPEERRARAAIIRTLSERTPRR